MDQPLRNADYPYRMKDLCDRTGLPRQAIHFYIHQGLIAEGLKTGRNMAYYSDSHVERILLIKKLQHERFLPLKAIRAVLDDTDDGFTPAQRRLFAEVKEQLPISIAKSDAYVGVAVSEVLLRSRIDRADFDAMIATGLFGTREDAHGRLLMRQDDVWMVELWSEVRQAGFSRELGFTPDIVMSIYEQAISHMFKQERVVLTTMLENVPAAEIARLVALGLPMIHRFLVRYHETKVRDFFTAM